VKGKRKYSLLALESPIKEEIATALSLNEHMNLFVFSPVGGFLQTNTMTGSDRSSLKPY